MQATIVLTNLFKHPTDEVKNLFRKLLITLEAFVHFFKFKVFCLFKLIISAKKMFDYFTLVT